MKAENLCRVAAGIVAILAAAIAPPALGKPVTFSVPETQGAPGSEVRIPIKVSGAKGMCGGQLEIHYDPRVLEAKKVEPGTLLEDHNTLVDSNPKEPGRLRIAFVGLEEISGEGELLRAVFAVKGAAGQTTPLEITALEAGQLQNMLELQAIPENGRFTVAGAAFSPPVWLVVTIGVVAVLALLALTRLGRRKTQPRP